MLLGSRQSHFPMDPLSAHFHPCKIKTRDLHKSPSKAFILLLFFLLLFTLSMHVTTRKKASFSNKLIQVNQCNEKD